MPNVERLYSQGFCPSDKQPITGFLVAVLDIGDTGICYFNAELRDALRELALAPTECEPEIFDPNHRS